MPEDIDRQHEIEDLLTHIVTVGDLLMNVQFAGCCDDTAANTGWLVYKFANRIKELGGAS